VTKGRPAAFDRDVALEQAMRTFWQHGYDTTSITALTAAMGINASSLYAAFGDKRSLFSAALQRYLAGPAGFTLTAMDGATTAYDSVRQLLHAAAAAYTRPGYPRGCLVISGATNCTPQSVDVQAELRAIRAQGRRALTRRISGAIRAQELAADTNPHTLATFYAGTLQAMSGLARDGATRTELKAVADLALAAWPAAKRQPASRSR
jgi:AcrR family transcriptional regulator